MARAAFPRECCGLIEGRITGGTAHVTALHPTQKSRPEPDRFEIDPAAHVRLLRALRGTDRAVDRLLPLPPQWQGRALARDRAGAAEEGFVWLIQPLTAEGAGHPAGFVFAAGASIRWRFPPEGFLPRRGVRRYKPRLPHGCSHRLAVRTRPSQG